MNRIANVTYDTLFKYMAITTGVGLSGVFLARGWYRRKFQETGYYQRTIKIFEGNETVGKLLGRPIKYGKLNLGDYKSFYVTPERAFVTLTARGPYDSGRLTSYCSRTPSSERAPGKEILADEPDDEIPDDGWEVMRVELRVSKHKDKRLIVFRKPEADEEFVNTFHDLV